MAEPATQRASTGRNPVVRRVGMLVLLLILTWLACGVWNSVKPMPAGTHVMSLPVRLAESQVEFIDDMRHGDLLLQREIAAVEHAEQMVVVDQCPLPRELAEHFLAAKRRRPNLRIVLVTDPRNETYGGTRAQTLTTLELAGIIVARTDLQRLRDSNPFYSSVWRLTLGWWSDAADETPGRETLMSRLRLLNATANRRQTLVADDGAGGWTSIVASDPAGLEVSGRLARDIAASELPVAAWSTDDDRLPAAPAIDSRSVGSIDARYLTEGAIHTALRDAIAVAGRDDTVDIMVRELGDRQIIHALLRAVARGAAVRILLDPAFPANRAVASELVHDSATRPIAGRIELRWTAARVARLQLVRHRGDIWLDLGPADHTRRSLDDLDLEDGIELHMPARAAPARAATAAFDREWSAAAGYAEHADDTPSLYWTYRIAEATGLAID